MKYVRLRWTARKPSGLLPAQLAFVYMKTDDWVDLSWLITGQYTYVYFYYDVNKYINLLATLSVSLIAEE